MFPRKLKFLRMNYVTMITKFTRSFLMQKISPHAGTAYNTSHKVACTWFHSMSFIFFLAILAVPCVFMWSVHPYPSGQLHWHCTAWWRHQMETFSALLAICAGNSPVPSNSPHKGQWRGALMFSLICVWINGWVNNGEAGDLRRYRTHYDVTVMGNRMVVAVVPLKLPCRYGQKSIDTDTKKCTRTLCIDDRIWCCHSNAMLRCQVTHSGYI